MSIKGIKDFVVDLGLSLILEIYYRFFIFIVGVDIYIRWFCGRSWCSCGGGGCGCSCGGGSFYSDVI